MYRVNLIKNWISEPYENLKLEIETGSDLWYEWSDFSRDDVKIDIREHRRYNFEKDFKIDFLALDGKDSESYKEESKKMDDIDKNYYTFELDFFEHGAISFSLVLDRMDIGYYEFDRSRNIWIIAVRKDGIDYKQALQIARDEIEKYNNFCNWWIESYQLYEKDIYKNQDWKELINWETVDSLGWYLDHDDCIKDAIENIKGYLKSKGVEFDDVAIEEI